MKKVVFEGWEVGMKKVSFYLMLKENSHLTLKESKFIKDTLVNENKTVEVEFKSSDVAKLIVSKSKQLGVTCRLKQ